MKGTILVVDDDAAMQQTIATILEDEGYHVVCAANGREALAQLEQDGFAPQLILLDVATHFLGDAWIQRIGWVKSGIMVLLLLAMLARLLEVLFHSHELIGTGERQIAPGLFLGAAAGLWLANVVVFAVAYWFLDEGGPFRVHRSYPHTSGAFWFPQLGQAGRHFACAHPAASTKFNA